MIDRTCYVSQKSSQIPFGQHPRKFSKLSEHTITVLIGVAGCGKTSLLQWWHDQCHHGHMCTVSDYVQYPNNTLSSVKTLILDGLDEYRRDRDPVTSINNLVLRTQATVLRKALYRITTELLARPSRSQKARYPYKRVYSPDMLSCTPDP